ncbi:MAG TPA: MmgE/PrpD family protein [Gaiellaceae bacterium]|jgi:2-methylcitrate dehydratase PrpD
MATAAERFATFALELELDDVPGEVVEAAKLHVLDVLGCGLAAHGLGIAGEGRTAMAELGGEPEASVIGLEAGLPAPNAAFANAMLCHGLDFDDTHSDSVSHVSTVVVPAAAALAEARGAGGRELLTAIVAGNEIVTRIGMATPGAFHRRGFHPTAICGIFGATAAAACLGGLSHAETASALGIAGSMASGLFAYLDDATATKPIHPAWAAHGALVAARLASLGAEGPPGVLEGRFGLYHAFVDTRIDLEPQLADLGERWETPRIAFKAFPACHFIHGSLGATASLVGSVDPDEVEEIVVTVPEAGVSLVLEPAESKVAPRTDYEGKFSLQYSTAAMLVHGRVGLATYTPEALADEKVLGLARKVRYETKEYASYPAAFPGGVRIVLRDGSTLDADLPHQLGAPENPMTAEQVRDKFRENAALAGGSFEALEQAVLDLEECHDVHAVLSQLGGHAVAA